MLIVDFPAYRMYWTVFSKFKIPNISLLQILGPSTVTKNCVNIFIAMITEKGTAKKIKKTSSTKWN